MLSITSTTTETSSPDKPLTSTETSVFIGFGKRIYKKMFKFRISGYILYRTVDLREVVLMMSKCKIMVMGGGIPRA
jgi:hypothetical protein